jgi:hypothetical protein
VAEWSIAAVLKTVEGHTSGGSNPSFSADKYKKAPLALFSFSGTLKLAFIENKPPSGTKILSLLVHQKQKSHA